MVLLHQIASELGIVNAVSALENHNVNRRAIGYAEGVAIGNGAGLLSRSATTAARARGQGATQRNQYGSSERTAQESAPFKRFLLNSHFLPFMVGAMSRARSCQ